MIPLSTTVPGRVLPFFVACSGSGAQNRVLCPLPQTMTLSLGL